MEKKRSRRRRHYVHRDPFPLGLVAVTCAVTLGELAALMAGRYVVAAIALVPLVLCVHGLSAWVRN